MKVAGGGGFIPATMLVATFVIFPAISDAEETEEFLDDAVDKKN